MTSQPRPEDTRPVWLTRDQINMLDAIGQTLQPIIEQHLAAIHAAWDAAPADAAKSLTPVIVGWNFGDFPSDHLIPRLLGALGYPHTEQA